MEGALSLKFVNRRVAGFKRKSFAIAACIVSLTGRIRTPCANEAAANKHNIITKLSFMAIDASSKLQLLVRSGDLNI